MTEARRISHADIKGSSLERQAAMLFAAHGLPPWEREYLFHPTLKYRFDYAWPGALAGLMGSDFEDTGSTPPRPRPRVHDQEVMSDRNDADNSCCQRQGRCAHAPGLSNKQVDPVSAGTPTGPRREKPC